MQETNCLVCYETILSQAYGCESCKVIICDYCTLDWFLEKLEAQIQNKKPTFSCPGAQFKSIECPKLRLKDLRTYLASITVSSSDVEIDYKCTTLDKYLLRHALIHS